MSAPGALQTAARVMLLALLALAPVTLGRLTDWEPFAALAAVAAAGLLWLAGGGAPPRWQWPDAALLAALLLAALILPWSVYLHDSLRALSLLTAGLGAFWLCRACLADAACNRAGWWVLAGGAAAAGLWGLREYAHTAIITGNVAWRTFGPFYNPNILAGYMALALLVPVALMLGARTRARAPEDDGDTSGLPRGFRPRMRSIRKESARKRGLGPAAPAGCRGSAPAPSASRGRAEPQEAPPRYPEIAGATCALVIALALLCTGSRGGMLAAFAAVPLFAVLGAARGTRAAMALRWGAAALVGAAVIAALTFPPVRNRITAAFGYQQHSASFRVLTWQGTADMVAARPLTGFGPGTFSRAFPRYARAGFTRQAHQTPLQLLAEHGLLGGGLLLLGIAGALWRTARNAARAQGPQRLLIAAAVAGGLGLWVHNLVDYTWYVAACNLAFWGLLGLAWAGGGAGAAGATPPARVMRFAGLVLSAALIAWSAVALHSDLQRASGARLARMGALGAARERLERVLPGDAYRWIELARLAEHEGRRGDPAALRAAVAHRLRAVALQPTEPTNHLALGRLHILLGDLEAAEAAYECAVELHPTSTDALLGLARARQARGHDAAALEAFGRLAALYDTPVRTAQAIEYFVDDNYAPAFLALAEDHLAHGRLPEALRSGTAALRVAVDFIRSQRAHRTMLEVAGRFDPERIAELESVAERAMALLRELDEPVAEARVGLALHGLERPAEAARVLEALIGRLADSPEPGRAPLEALARLTFAEALEATDEQARAARERAEGLRVARQVLPQLAANRAPIPSGWDGQDGAALQAAAARAGG